MAYIKSLTTKTAVITGYKPFYIQSATDASAIDTRTSYGMVAKVNPYPIMPQPKEPYSNDWKDQNGADEYNTVMYYKPFDMTVSFYAKALTTVSNTAPAELRSWLNTFFDKIKNGEFKIYDAYTNMGFQHVRYNGYAEESFKARGNWASAIFSITFRVNDPTTRMKLASGSITTL